MAQRTFTVNEQGQRLDKFLCQALTLSRREALRLLENGLVKLNGHTVSRRDKGRLLEPRSVIELENPDAVLGGLITPEPEAPLYLLAEGNGYVVVNKAAGQAVMPLRTNETGTVLNALVARYPQLQDVGEGGLRSGVVHRLDTDTSGTLVVAIRDDTWLRLRRAFKEHRTTKLYYALVHGQLWGVGQENMHLTITQHRPAKVSVVVTPTSSSRHCDLRWRALETFEKATLLEVSLGTGFLHQIRAMFAHKGHPVIGDKTYGTETDRFGAARQMLHAASIRVEDVEAQSPNPADFREALDCLKSHS